LKQLLLFDPTKRITVEQALAHPFLSELRDKEAEKRHPGYEFHFEDRQTDMKTMQSLIMDEVIYYQAEK